jgi:hypothetical protein
MPFQFCEIFVPEPEKLRTSHVELGSETAIVQLPDSRIRS